MQIKIEAIINVPDAQAEVAKEVIIEHYPIQIDLDGLVYDLSHVRILAADSTN
jgi:hypothetical protein